MPEPIKIFFLGTGGSTPFNNRNFPCIALKFVNNLILFDFGENCQFSLLKNKIHPLRHDIFILISHFHADHTTGLPGLLHTLNLVGMKNKVVIIGPIGLKRFMERIFDAFLIGYADFNLELIEIKKIDKITKVYKGESFSIFSFPTLHSVPSVGYIFKEDDFKKFDAKKAEKLGLPVGPLRKKLLKGEKVHLKGKIIKPEDVIAQVIKGRKIVYTGDTIMNETIIEAAKHSDLLICEGTFLDRDFNEALKKMHATIGSALKAASEAKVKKLAIVHTSPRYDSEEIEKEISKNDNYRFDVLIPNDGQVLVL